MTDRTLSLHKVYSGWDDFQQTLVTAVAPLTPERLVLRSAPHLRSIGEILAHIISARVAWFHIGLGVGDEEVERFRAGNQGPSSASELVDGLEATWSMIHDALKSWGVADLDGEVKASFRGKDYLLPRQWVIWHVIEHDLHHGGELLLTLGIHNLPTPAVGMVTDRIKEL